MGSAADGKGPGTDRVEGPAGPADRERAGAVTRRSIVAGVGVLAGATVLALNDASPATAEGAAPAVPQSAAAGGPDLEPALLTAGLTYRTFDVLAFQPTNAQFPDVAVSFTGAYVTSANALFFAPLELPSGSVLKELSLAGANSSGVTQTLTLYRQQFDAVAAGSVVQTTLASGDTTLRTSTVAFTHVIDAAYSYYLAATTRTGATQTVHGARVGYQPAADAGSFRPLAVPVRIYDSRAGEKPLGGIKGKFADHEERVLDAKLGTGVPAGASSVLVNLAATNTNPGGYFSLFKNGVVWPLTSTLNWGSANSTVSSLSATQLATNATFKARCEGAGGADLVVDVVGWFT